MVADSRQLDLFDWRPPCQVHAFPLGRLLGRARRIAELSDVTSSGAMDYIWRWEINDLDGALASAGMSEDDREKELGEFTQLVRRLLNTRRQGTGA